MAVGRECINCWRGEPDCEFYPDDWEWQYKQRCTLCERKYQSEFAKKYPKIRRTHNIPALTEAEEREYEEIMIFRRGERD